MTMFIDTIDAESEY